MTMSEPLLPASFLFRYSVPCLYLPDGNGSQGGALGEVYRLPNFTPLDGGPEGPEVRAGWNESGLTLSLEITGKRQLPWCRDNRIEDSDGLHIWIDTRDTHKPKAWLEELGVGRLAYYADPSGRVFQDLKLAGWAFGMPTTLLIDGAGCEIGALAGPAEWASEDALALVRALIAG